MTELMQYCGMSPPPIAIGKSDKTDKTFFLPFMQLRKVAWY